MKALLFGGIIALILFSPHEMISTPEQCYSIVGKDNITKESWDDWEQHAYIGDKLVCAHGQANLNGLTEEIVYTPLPTIKVHEVK